MIDEYGNNIPRRSLPVRKILIFSIIAIVVLSIGLWVYNHAFIEVSVSSGAGGQISYQLTDQSSNKTGQTDSTEKSVKKLVSRSNYQVLVQQGNLNYFSVVKTAGFLTTTHVTATMQSEKSRQFVGNNPASCMTLVKRILISYVCSEAYNNAQIHQPATAAQPTYTLKNPNPTSDDGFIEGMVQTNQGNLALIHTPSDSEQGQIHFIYFIDSNLKVLQKVQLKGADSGSTYTIASYNDGFILYGEDYGDVLYYPTAQSQPQRYKLDSPSDTNLQPVSADFFNAKYAVLRSNSDDHKAGSIVSVASQGRTNHYNFKTSYTKVRFCGTNKICLLGGKAMDVYDLNGDEPDYLYSIVEAADINRSGASLLVATTKQIINLNVDRQDGFVEYSLGDYTYNNMQILNNGYLLSVTNQKGAAAALWINRAEADNSNLDKKVAQLEDTEGVSSVSVYGNYIYIVPSLGDQTEYNIGTNTYDYDPAVKRSVASTINQKLNSLGIDKRTYKVIIPGL